MILKVHSQYMAAFISQGKIYFIGHDSLTSTLNCQCLLVQPGFLLLFPRYVEQGTDD
jgi:hypothetical protein